MSGKIKIISIAVILLGGLGVLFMVTNKNNQMKNLPSGIYLNQFNSPDSKYILKAYNCNDDIRIELIDNNNIKNIYYGEKDGELKIRWINDDDVSIDNHIIDLPNGYYNYKEK